MVPATAILFLIPIGGLLLAWVANWLPWNSAHALGDKIYYGVLFFGGPVWFIAHKINDLGVGSLYVLEGLILTFIVWFEIIEKHGLPPKDRLPHGHGGHGEKHH